MSVSPFLCKDEPSLMKLPSSKLIYIGMANPGGIQGKDRQSVGFSKSLRLGASHGGGGAFNSHPGGYHDGRYQGLSSFKTMVL